MLRSCIAAAVHGLPALAALICAASSAAAWAAPRITNVAPHGLLRGATTTIVLDGRELLPDPQVMLSVPIARQVVKPGATAARLELELTLDDDVTPGIYPLRICNDRGVSSPVLIAVDDLPSREFSSTIETLPVSLNGRLAGSQILSAAFDGKKGQRIVLDLQARRLASTLDGVVRLYDPRGAQIAWSPPRSIVAGDARCEATLPADGRYTIEVHDRNYRAPAPAFFRLNVGDLHYADLAFPLGATVGSGLSPDFVSAHLPKEFVHKLQFSRGDGEWLPTGIETAMFSGPQPLIVVSSFPELVESPTGDGGPQQLSPAPVAVSGRISAKDETDQYALSVRGGAKLRIDVLADRGGSPLDGVLVVRRKNGQQLARGDDRAGSSDPSVEVTVPNNEDTLLLSLNDLRGAGGDEFVYRIEVEEAGPDFDLSLEEDTVNVPAGGSQLLVVRAKRNKLNVPIELAFDGLPAGVDVSGNWIDAGDEIGLVTLSAAGRDSSCGLARITGQARVGEDERVVIRNALLPDSVAARRQPWLREEMGVAVSRVAPLSIAWADDANDARLLLGGNQAMPVTIQRRGNTPGKVRLRLVSTQPMPTKTVKQRNRDVTMDDPDRALRLSEAIELGEDVDGPSAARIAVPDDLAEKTWSAAIVAELLAKDGKTVVASAATPVRRLKAQRGVKLALTSDRNINAVAGDGDTGAFKGTIERLVGLSGPVNVTLAGLANQYPAPKVEIPAGENEFELEVRFPPNAPPADLKNLRLIATMLADPDDPKSTVQSNAAEVNVKVARGGP